MCHFIDYQYFKRHRDKIAAGCKGRAGEKRRTGRAGKTGRQAARKTHRRPCPCEREAPPLCGGGMSGAKVCRATCLRRGDALFEGGEELGEVIFIDLAGRTAVLLAYDCGGTDYLPHHSGHILHTGRRMRYM